MNTTQKLPKLFALLIGIDTYQKPITPLNGCVNDVQKIEALLEQQKTSFEVHSKTLINEQALKTAIVAQFRTHLGNAKEGDTVLFYYSGHGTQEEANPVFWHGNPDKKLESLVCYDGVVVIDGKPETNLLADKELRFLIEELAQKNPHIISIFDCCHSGTNTRNSSFTASDKNVLERKAVNTERLSMAFPERPWSHFIFSKTISESDVREKGVTSLFKEGKHIQMAACQNDESAFEVAGEGVFTKNLVDVLQRCNGNISYHRLQSTIQSYLRHQFKQTPKIYVTGNDSQLFLNFLNNGVAESELYGTVSFHKDLEWILDMGSIQGITTNKEIVLVEQNSGTTYKGEVTSVHVSYSQISIHIDNNTSLNEDLIFRAKTSDIIGRTLQLYITPDIQQHTNGNMLAQKLKDLNAIHLVEVIEQSDYCLSLKDDLLIFGASERIATPLVPEIPITNFNQEGISILSNYMEHISKFEFVKYLTNAGGFLLRPDHISIQFFVGDTLISYKNEELLLEYIKTQTGWGGAIKIKIKNVSNKKLYCALCYLSFNFGVYTKLLPAGVEGLEPGAEAWALDGAPIQFKLEPEIIALDYKESNSFIKLLVSTEDFTQQLNTLTQDDLPNPLKRNKETMRGLAFNGEPEVIHDWTSRLITLRMPNPEL